MDEYAKNKSNLMTFEVVFCFLKNTNLIKERIPTSKYKFKIGERM